MKSYLNKFLLTVVFIFPTVVFAQEVNTWRLSPDAWGPVHIGMTVAEASKATQQKFNQANGGMIPQNELTLGKCQYVKLANIEDVAFLVKKEKIVRIEVSTKKVQTDRGAKVGDSENKIKSLYKNKLSNVEGNFLLYVPPHNPYGLMFETSTMSKKGNLAVINISAGAVSALKQGCVTDK